MGYWSSIRVDFWFCLASPDSYFFLSFCSVRLTLISGSGDGKDTLLGLTGFPLLTPLPFIFSVLFSGGRSAT